MERIWYSKVANDAGLELQELKLTHKYNHMHPFSIAFCLCGYRLLWLFDVLYIKSSNTSEFCN